METLTILKESIVNIGKNIYLLMKPIIYGLGDTIQKPQSTQQGGRKTRSYRKRHANRTQKRKLNRHKKA